MSEFRSNNAPDRFDQGPSRRSAWDQMVLIVWLAAGVLICLLAATFIPGVPAPIVGLRGGLAIIGPLACLQAAAVTTGWLYERRSAPDDADAVERR